MRAFGRLLIIVAGILSLAACESGRGGAPNEMGRLGRPEAPVEVIEYASMSCIHCATFNNTDFQQLKAKYIDTGKVKWELREILTGPVELSAAGFMLARCAGQERYFTVVDAIFHNLQDIVANQRAGLLNIARSAGMTEADFEKCIGDEAELKALNERVRKNADQAPRGTPTFWVDGKMHTGEPTAAELSKLIDAALAAK